MNTEDDLDTMHICNECVREDYLSAEITRTAIEQECDYCHSVAPCMSLAELADRIESAFDDYYVRTSDQPSDMQFSMMSDKDGTYDWERDGQPVVEAIEEAAQIPTKAAEAIRDLLAARHANYDHDTAGDETAFASSSYYEETAATGRDWHLEWQGFEDSLKSETRFFSRSSRDLLTRVFANLDRLATRPRHRAVVTAGPGRKLNHLFRARVFQSEEPLKEALERPDRFLGPPPPRFAPNGRMNARGIAVFYGATNSKAALAEVRPPVSSQVAIARFDIIRPLRLLDLTALDHARDGGSMFDATLSDRLERAAFLRSLGRRLSRAVLPDDEAFDYLATQAVADFLANETQPRFDGIIFQSAQARAGRNLVLFHHASYVEALDFPKGTQIRAYTTQDTDEGPEIDYWVFEESPDPAETKAKPQSPVPFLPDWDSWTPEPFDPRDPALRVQPASVAVHHVQWVEIRTTMHEVRRHRATKHNKF